MGFERHFITKIFGRPHLTFGAEYINSIDHKTREAIRDNAGRPEVGKNPKVLINDSGYEGDEDNPYIPPSSITVAGRANIIELRDACNFALRDNLICIVEEKGVYGGHTEK